MPKRSHPWWYYIGRNRGLGYLPYSTRRRFAHREIIRSRTQRIAAASILSRLYKTPGGPKLVAKIKSYL